MKPFTVFVGSSTEGQEIAECFVKEMDKRPFFKMLPWWNPEAFPPGKSFFDALIAISRRVDFAVLIATADDLKISRATAKEVARDNVLFEFAMFVGQLGKNRVVLARTVENLPSDLHGISNVKIPTSHNDCSDWIRECEQALLDNSNLNRCSELLFQIGQRARSSDNLGSLLTGFHEEIRIQSTPVPPNFLPSSAIKIFRRIRAQRDRILPGGRGRNSKAQPYFELSNATTDEIFRLASIAARRIIKAADTECAKARCATRIAIWRSPDRGNLNFLETVIEQCGLRPILVDLSTNRVLGPYTQGEKVVLAYDFLNTGDTPLRCVQALQNKGLVVGHIVALCARESEYDNAIASARSKDINAESCFVVRTDGSVRPFS